ncbi:MAG: FtsQ-type POTRA domain-containing protein [Kiritimatiellia bacterium]
MRWITFWRRADSEERKTNRKRNTVSSVGGRAAEVSGRRHARLVYSTYFVLIAAFAGIVLWLAIGKIGEELLSTNPEYRLRVIDVVSDGKLAPPAKVKQWAEIDIGMNMHEIDIGKIRKSLLRSVPVIKSMEIRRLMPDRIEIRLSERLPIACLGLHRSFGVDPGGYVFAIPPAGASMPTITGSLEQISPGICLQGRLLNAVEVVDMLNRTSLGALLRVEALDVRDPECLLLKLADGPLVRLSWPDMAMSTPDSRLALDGKLRSLARVLDDARMKNKRLSKVDMTFSDDYIPSE